MQRYNMRNCFWKNWNLKFALCVWVRYFHVFDTIISIFGTLVETEFYASWGIFWAIFFSSKTVCFENCLQILSKKTFRFLENVSAGLAILHAISIDEYYDVSFRKESTLIRVWSFEEKEQKTIWFYSKWPPFFLRTAFCFSPLSFAFFVIKNPNS